MAQGLAFERRFELILGNFIEFELAATEWSLRAHLVVNHSYEWSASLLAESDRFIMNILSTTRSYLDQVKQDFKHLSLVPSFYERVRAETGDAYDNRPNSANYRFMEALRNLIQHRANPSHTVKQKSGVNHWTEYVTVTGSKNIYAEDPKFKKQVLDEMGDEVDLRAAMRDYVSLLSEVHWRLREVLAPHLESARSTTETALNRYNASFEASGGVVALEETDGADTECFPVLLKWDDVRRNLAAKHRNSFAFTLVGLGPPPSRE